MPDNADIADLNPAFRAKLDPFLNGLANAGISARVISGYRSPELQQKLYANFQARQAGRALPYPQEGSGGIAAPAWNSFHNFGLAADVQPANAADYPRMWALATQYGLTPLAQKDEPHIQMPGSLSDNIAQYNLAGWRPASQPAPAQGAIAYAAPSQTVMPDEARGAPSRPYSPTPAQPPTAIANFTLPANAPMGMRNNNPLNIKYYKGAPYEGLIGPSANTDQGDPQMVFQTPEQGWAAAYSLLNKKYGSGMTTPNKIIAGEGGWTPGNTQAALNVAKSAGIGPDDDIGFSDPGKAAKFMRALVAQEQGGAGSAYPDAMIMGAVTGKPAPPGTTINTIPLAAGGGGGGDDKILPGFSDAKTSNKFQKDVEAFSQAAGYGQAGDQTPRAPPMGPGPIARNVSPLGGAMLPMAQALGQQITGYQPQPYGHTLTSLADPTQWGSAPPGQAPYAATGLQAPQAGASPYGTSLAGLQMAYGLSPQQLQMMLSPIMLSQGGSFG